MARTYRPFVEARAYVRALGLIDAGEWASYCRGDLKARFGLRPDDIAANAPRVYRNRGWQGMRDWLGPAPLAPVEPGFLDFKRARTYARTLGLRNSVAWHAWCRGAARGGRRRPANIPEDPARMYPRAWRGWADWLGTERRPPKSKSRYIPFDEARAFVRALGLRSVSEWRAYSTGRLAGGGSRPPEIPACPDMVYEHAGWNGYGDWLGTGHVGGRVAPYWPFEEAREFVQELGLNDGDEYRTWARGGRPDLPQRPAEVPSNPQRSYRNAGWTSWGEFLGTGFVACAKRRFRSFDAARAYAQSLGLKRNGDWRAHCAARIAGIPVLPADVPANPDVHYRRSGWTSWGDFLGTGIVATTRRNFRDFESARSFVRTLHLSSIAEWRAYVAGRLHGLPPLPQDVPASPDTAYAEAGWRGWPDFQGRRGTVHDKLPFEEARALVHRLGLRAMSDWNDWMLGERADLPVPPPEIPMSPPSAYRRDGWRGWGDFLGTGRPRRKDRAWRSFDEARQFARTLRLRSREQWSAHGHAGQRPWDIPAKPHLVYAGRGWRGWPDFLRGDAHISAPSADAGS